MLVDKKAAIALKEPSVLTSATVRAAERLQIKNAALARILGGLRLHGLSYAQ